MTSNVHLRNVVDSDLPIFFEQQLDPDACQMAAFPSRDREAFMAHWAKILRDETNTLKTILCDGQVAGNIVSWQQGPEREVGYWLGKEYWGQGIATRALAEFLGHVTARPLYAYVARHNLASRQVLEKCGFTLYGEAAEEFRLMLGANNRDESDLASRVIQKMATHPMATSLRFVPQCA